MYRGVCTCTYRLYLYHGFLLYTKPAYGVYISQLVRIGRICDRYEDFKERHRILATRLLKQGYKYDQLCSYFKRFSGKYKDIFGKFRMTTY